VKGSKEERERQKDRNTEMQKDKERGTCRGATGEYPFIEIRP